MAEQHEVLEVPRSVIEHARWGSRERRSECVIAENATRRADILVRPQLHQLAQEVGLIRARLLRRLPPVVATREAVEDRFRVHTWVYAGPAEDRSVGLVTRCMTCRLEGNERRRYDDLRRDYRAALLPAVECDGVGRSAMIVLEALLRLRQAALHPALLDPDRIDEPSAKLDALIEQLREAIGAGHRALVFSQFTSMLAIIQRRLEREKIACEYLDGKTEDRRERVAAFQSGSAPVFLLSLKAGGTGLNLTRADHVFLFDPWWNPAVEAQAIDRIHRIGQDRPVTAYRLVAEDTVEAKILTLQDHKRALFSNLFEDKGVLARMTAADIKALLD